MREELCDQTQTDGQMQRDLSRESEVTRRRAIMFRIIEFNACHKILWIRRMLQKGRDRKYLSSPIKIKKISNAILILIETTHRK